MLEMIVSVLGVISMSQCLIITSARDGLDRQACAANRTKIPAKRLDMGHRLSVRGVVDAGEWLRAKLYREDNQIHWLR
jgi:hypothetical protein